MGYRTRLWISAAGLFFFLGIQSVQATRYKETQHIFEVSNAIQSNMVIQQGKPFTFWGRGWTGQKVHVKASWTDETATATVDGDGFWECKLPVGQAPQGAPKQTVHIKYDKEERVFDNILIGEVWYLSGQSNMEMTMEPVLPWHEGVENWETEVAAADCPELRFITYERVADDIPQWNCRGRWEVCSPATVGKLSGIGYYFARKLMAATNLPVGLILTAWGSKAGQCYVSEEALSADPVLYDKYVKPFKENPQSVGFDFQPSRLYNTLVYPFLKMSIRGFLWFQGENNADQADIYDRMQTCMIADWRERFGQGDLPFYFVEVGPNMWWPDNKAFPIEPDAYYHDEYAYFREGQHRIRENNVNCELVVVTDVCNPPIAHTRNKKPVGERLAQIALARDYGFTSLEYHSPRYKGHKVEGRKVRISFDYVPTGLSTNDGKVPKLFFVAGADKKFYHAKAKIEGKEIVLTVPRQVKTVAAVRYAFLNCPMSNAQSSEGLPIEPFRSDDWTGATFDKSQILW